MLTVVAVGATAEAATAAAGGRERVGGSSLDRSVSCATEAGALRILAFATDPAARAAAASVGTGEPAANQWLVAVDTRYAGYTSGKLCREVTTRLAFTHRGLVSAGVSSAGDYSPRTLYCSATRHVLVRFRLAFDSARKPLAATLVVWSQPQASGGGKAGSRPIASVQWSPKRSVSYYSSAACTSR